jgi:branched-chain amino acid transport system substrate-binding protein
MHKPLLALLVLTFMPTVASSQAADSVQMSDGVVETGVVTDMSSVYSEGSGSGSLMAARMAAMDFGGTIRGNQLR